METEHLSNIQNWSLLYSIFFLWFNRFRKSQFGLNPKFGARKAKQKNLTFKKNSRIIKKKSDSRIILWSRGKVKLKLRNPKFKLGERRREFWHATERTRQQSQINAQADRRTNWRKGKVKDKGLIQILPLIIRCIYKRCYVCPSGRPSVLPSCCDAQSPLPIEERGNLASKVGPSGL